MKALIGSTGFIGKNLKKRIKFDKFFNSSNIHKAYKYNFDEVYCAAPHSLKFYANKYPLRDKIIVNKLITSLKLIKCRKFIHISTIEVYPKKTLKLKRKKINECTNIFKYSSSAYGQNRKLIEKFIINNFNNYLIIRLPSLFGNGLKKNVIFDLINKKPLWVSQQSLFQWYAIEDLAKHIKILKRKKIKVINLVPEPISVTSLCSLFKHQIEFNSKKKFHYKIFTKFSRIFGKKKYENFIYSKKTVLKKIKKFIKNNK